MNIRAILYYLGLFFSPIIILAFFNILFSSYYNYFLNIDSYVAIFFISIFLSSSLVLIGRKCIKEINFLEQLVLMLLIFIFLPLLISIPFYLSNYNITFLNSYFESISGFTGTGFTIFDNIKYLDPTLIIWRSSAQWIGGLYFLIFLIIFFSNTKGDYKLTSLIFNPDKSSNLSLNLRKTSIKIFFLYSILTILIFIMLSLSGIRLFNGLNLSLSLISNGGFIPTTLLEQIIKSNFQKIVFIISLTFSSLNIYFFYNLFFKDNIKTHYEDYSILILGVLLSIILILFIKDLHFLDIIIATVSSLTSSGLTIVDVPHNFSFLLVLMTLVGGSILSSTSGLKFMRIYILIKASAFEIYTLVKPNNIVNRRILYTDKKITSNNIKNAFFIFISFFISLFVLTAMLLIDNFNFEDSFKFSILTLTNTVNSSIYGIEQIDFKNLLTSTKISIIIFMIIAKIELISVFIILKEMLFKN